MSKQGCKLTRRGEQLARWALGNILAHKVEEDGNSEYLDTAEDYLSELLGPARAEQVLRGIDQEYAGSGLLDDDSDLTQVGLYIDGEPCATMKDANRVAQAIGWQLQERVDIGVFLCTLPEADLKRLQKRGQICKRKRLDGEQLTGEGEMP